MFKNTFISLFSPLTVDNNKIKYIENFSTIDFLRGISAFIIIIYHYYHFYWTPNIETSLTGIDINKTVLPFYNQVSIIYVNGYWAVQFFWLISGFVFAHMYAQKETKFQIFFINRFSRLYPIHFITLIFIVIIQYISLLLVNNNQFTGFLTDSLYNFLLNLTFVQYLGFQNGNYSFNTSAWSVSVEIIIYLLFFMCARYVFILGLIIPSIFIFAGYVIMTVGTPFWYIGICAFYFF